MTSEAKNGETTPETPIVAMSEIQTLESQQWRAVPLCEKCLPKWMLSIPLELREKALACGITVETGSVAARDRAFISSKDLFGAKPERDFLKNNVGRWKELSYLLVRHHGNALLIDLKDERETSWIDDLSREHPDLSIHLVPKHADQDKKQNTYHKNFSKADKKRKDRKLDQALEDSFPASDPKSIGR